MGQGKARSQAYIQQMAPPHKPPLLTQAAAPARPHPAPWQQPQPQPRAAGWPAPCAPAAAPSPPPAPPHPCPPPPQSPAQPGTCWLARVGSRVGGAVGTCRMLDKAGFSTRPALIMPLAAQPPQSSISPSPSLTGLAPQAPALPARTAPPIPSPSEHHCPQIPEVPGSHSLGHILSAHAKHL